MRTDIVFTLTGPDRVGIVEEVTKGLLGVGANIETSRMARLGGEFAILMLVELPQEAVAKLDAAFEHLSTQGYKISTRPTEKVAAPAGAGCAPYRIEVSGADHEGIIHEIAAGLSRRGINIESMETGTSSAAESGISLFSMIAIVSVPGDLAEASWVAELEEAGHEANVDITVSPGDHL